MGGAATAGVISGGLEATGATYNLAKKGLGKLGDMTANRAAQGINKATPTMFNNAVEQHGIDLGKLTQKYVPPGSSYDDLIGGISDRGNGGSFNEILNKAEDQIQSTSQAAGTNVKISGDDLIAALKQEAAKMKGQLGGGACGVDPPLAGSYIEGSYSLSGMFPSCPVGLNLTNIFYYNFPYVKGTNPFVGCGVVCVFVPKLGV